MIIYTPTCEFTPGNDKFFSDDPNDHEQTIKLSPGGMEISARDMEISSRDVDISKKQKRVKGIKAPKRFDIERFKTFEACPRAFTHKKPIGIILHRPK